MNVLVIGSGGREHAIVWKARQSQKINHLYALPGNPGTAGLAENISGISIEDHAAVAACCKIKQIELVIVGPEAPLAGGIADSLWAAGFRCFGPKRAAAKIEASKVFAKDFMARHHIPTARYTAFHQVEEAIRYLETVDYPIVIKASGLAAGKGVILPDTVEEARSALKAILVEKAFGDAGDEVIIEERLVGQEVSLMAFTDGTSIAPMLPAQDHKRLLDGDQGPNTGGMGAYAPAPIMTPEVLRTVERTIIQPTVRGMARDGRPYSGCLYVGLMITEAGPKVVEYNCRFGDPETQVVLPLYQGDLVDLLLASANGHIEPSQFEQERATMGAAVCVVLASAGYPDAYPTGREIHGLESIAGSSSIIAFHAGTSRVNNHVVTSGGRVLGVTALRKDGVLASTIHDAYDGVRKISFEGMHFRRDIGRKGLGG